MPRDEKDRVKVRLVSRLAHEREPKLSVQITMLVSRIARFEFPTEWPSVLYDLFGIFKQIEGREDFTASSKRLFMAMNQVVKTLSSKTIPACRLALTQVAPEIFHGLFPIFKDSAGHFIANGGSTNDTNGTGQVAFYALKTLYRLMIFSGNDNISSDSMQVHTYTKIC